MLEVEEYLNTPRKSVSSDNITTQNQNRTCLLIMSLPNQYQTDRCSKQTKQR